MNTNIATASLEGPRHNYFFLEDSDAPGMASSHQKRTLTNLILLNIEDEELRERHIQQLRDISEKEARVWIKELESGLW